MPRPTKTAPASELYLPELSELPELPSLASPKRHRIEEWLSFYPPPGSPPNDCRCDRYTELRKIKHQNRRMPLSELQGHNINTAPALKKRTHDTCVDSDQPDPDATPRASKMPRRSTFEAAVAESSNASSDASSQQDTESNGSSHKSGRMSPQKKLMALEDLWNPVVMRDLGNRLEDKPAKVVEFEHDIRYIANGHGILELRLRDDPSFQSIRQHEGAFSDDWRFTDYRSGDSLLPELRILIDIHKSATDCSELNSAEPEWNESVHLPILKHSLGNSTYARYLQCPNIRARLDKILRPDLGNGDRMSGSMVDYAITLKANHPDFTRAFQQLKDPPGAKTFNQTLYSAIRHTPIAVSIETKSASTSWTEARAQIAIWVSAQFTKWRQILDSQTEQPQRNAVQLPVLPLIVVQGHDWHFLAASQTFDSTDGRSKTIIWQKITFGSTDTVFGICQIVVALQYLAQWAHLQLRPWFLKNFLRSN